MDIEKVGNKFKVAILAAKRAKQIMKHGKKKIDLIASNPLTIALEEIKQGLVTYETIIEDEKNSFINLGETEVLEEGVESINADGVAKTDEKATKEEILKKNLTT